MTKHDFYETSKQRDKALERQSVRWAISVMLLLLAPTVGTLIFNDYFGQPSPLRGWIYLCYAVLILIIYMPVTAALRKRINKAHGMLCIQCGNAQEGSALVHIAFTNSCLKCGRAAYETPGAEQRTR